MTDLLNDIWLGNICPIEKTVLTEEMRDIEHIMENLQTKLSKNISPDMQEILEKFARYTTELIGISEQAAFIKGVRFATQFFMEALSET